MHAVVEILKYIIFDEYSVIGTVPQNEREEQKKA
jgi:hypothetical protein